MFMYPLSALRRKALRLGRELCAWRPYPIPHGMGDRWIYDPGTQPSEYRENLGIDFLRHRIIVRPDGVVED